MTQEEKKSFENMARMLNVIADTQGTIQKVNMIKYFDTITDEFRAVLKFIYNPNFKTGIGMRSILDATEWTPATNGMGYKSLMDYLKVNNFGDNATLYLAAAFCNEFRDNYEIYSTACRFIAQDLQIGVSVTMLNKIFGKNFIPKIGIMRGMKAPDNFKGIYLASEKIDGNRRIIMNKESGAEAYTRSGKRDYGLVDVIREFEDKMPKGYVYDTECTKIGNFKDSIELRQASASVLNSGGVKVGVRCQVFDIMTQEEYDAGISKDTALMRKVKLATVMNDHASVDMLHRYFIAYDIAHGTHHANTVNALYSNGRRYTVSDLQLVEPLPILGVVHDMDDALALAQPFWDEGLEGIMLVEYTSPYEVNPNPRKTLLKIKATVEFELLCVGVYEGDNGNEGTLGGIMMQYVASDNQMYLVNCGSGFSKELRDLYWDNPGLIVGQIVEGESFGESRNKQGNYSLSCPIFKRIKEED